MASNKSQAARRAAERRLMEAHEDEFRGYMEEEFSVRGLTYKPRLTAQEREERDALERKLKAAQRIAKIAKTAGIDLGQVDQMAELGDGLNKTFEGDASGAVELDDVMSQGIGVQKASVEVDLTGAKQAPLTLE